MKIVIADAGPLIALSRINKLDILKQLFDQIIITDIIQNEVLLNEHEKGKDSIRLAIKSNWIIVKNVDLNGWKPINSGVDAGESSAIYFAKQSPEKTLLIIDDQAGRAEARYQKIQIIGTAAVIGIAKEQGLIDSASEVLHRMRDQGYYIADNVIETILNDVGE